MNEKKLNSIDWNQILNALQELTSSELARERMAELSPVKTPKEAKASFDEIFSALQLILSQERIHFLNLDSSVSWLPRIEKQATLKTLELKDIRSFLKEAHSLELLLQEDPDGHFARKASVDSNSIHEPISAIDHIISESGEIKTDASETLYNLYNEKKGLSQQLEKSLDRLVKENQMEPILQDRFVTNREGRWVIPVKSGMQHELPGIIHSSSHSKQTVFMEPQEVIPVNNRLKKVETEIEEEIERLLKEISLFLSQYHSQFLQLKEQLILADQRMAQAELTHKLQANPCQFKEDSISLFQLKHPSLVLQGDAVVPNELHLNSDQPVLILSGPNAGGKTVLLKSVGLAIHMARCGLPICANSESHVPFTENIYISVGDEQSVDENLSTFAAHLKDLNACLNATGNNNLVLIDEICGSTDPDEGGALARSFIEQYAKNKTFAIITSHLGLLKIGWDETSGVINGSLAYDSDSGSPTYKFISGISGQSQAIQTARRSGVQKDILDRAISLLSAEGREQLRKNDSIESLKSQLQVLLDQQREKNFLLNKEKEKYSKLIKEIEEESQKRIDQNIAQAKEKIDEMVTHARVNEIFKRQSDVETVKHNFPKVIKGSLSTEEVNSAENFSKKFPPGKTAYVSSLKQNAVIQSTPNAKGDVTVQAQSMRLQVHWTQIKDSSESKEISRKKGGRFQQRSTTFDVNQSDLDLRGQTIENGIETLEKHLDWSFKNDLDQFKVIHGHGTEALKKAIRSHLSRSTYVHSWQTGHSHSGGDGVTWVKLSD